MKLSILIIDDEISSCTFLSLALKHEYNVQYALTARDGIDMYKSGSFDLVLLDMVIGSDSGMDVLREIMRMDPDASVIMMTAFGSIRTSVEAIQNGAFNYLAKPLDIDELRVYIRQALSVRRLNEEVDLLNDELSRTNRYQEMVGQSAPMRQVYSMIDKVRDLDCNVVLTGESGTGKELAARAVHFSGKRKKEHFVVINCAAIPESLLEEELFGHKRGSFTGAMQDKKGKLEIADHGTVFLDEIGDMPHGLQSKLLRAIQQKEFTPLGSTVTRKVDIRIIAATNRNLKEMVKRGEFREDLYYRLNVINIHMPSLRERREDIPALCSYLINRFNHEQNKNVQCISQPAMDALMKYAYPGNVRQLANILEYATILTSGREIRLENLPIEVSRQSITAQLGDEAAMHKQLAGRTLSEIEREAIAATLEKNHGRRDITAKELGISVRGLLNKITQYKL